MATLDWPTDRAFGPRAFRWGHRTPKSAFNAFFSGESQSISHLGDRLRAVITMPKCEPRDAARREAFVMELVSAGHTVRLWPMHRAAAPLGTLRGAPTIAAAAAAGARQVQIQSTAGATLEAGDVLAAAGYLMLASYAGAVANGAGLLTLPLALPTRVALAAGTAVTWQRPVGSFQLAADLSDFSYGRARWQDELELQFSEV